MELTLLQKEEIEMGKENGLSDSQIALFATEKLNFKKMAVLRQALENGVSEDVVTQLAKSRLNAQEMQEYLDHGQSESIPKHHVRRIMPIILAICTVLLVGMFVLLQQKLVQSNEPLQLELSQSEVTIACDETFDAKKYVSLQTGSHAKLQLPESIDTSMPGTYILSYTLQGPRESIQKLLRVKVVDHTAPEILLKRKYATILKGAPFSCQGYVEKAYDNVSGDLSDQVTCSNSLSNEAHQKIRYAVKDDAGNEAETFLSIVYTDPLEEEEAEEKDEEPIVQVPRPQVVSPVITPVPQVEYEETYISFEYVEEPNDPSTDADAIFQKLNHNSF